MAKAVLSKSQLDSIYRDMMARIQMGLLNNEDGEICGDAFGENLREAILEKMPAEQQSDKHRKVDIFSVAFGAISERILREHYQEKGKEWW